MVTFAIVAAAALLLGLGCWVMVRDHRSRTGPMDRHQGRVWSDRRADDELIARAEQRR